MSDKEIKNAKITNTMLGVEDHGIMTCLIYLDYGGSEQAFGGYAFDTYDNWTKKRIGTSWGMDFIMEILKVCEVEKWEDLIGKHIRVEADYSKVYRIGHILKDKWFDPKIDLKLQEG